MAKNYIPHMILRLPLNEKLKDDSAIFSVLKNYPEKIYLLWDLILGDFSSC